MPVPIYSKQVFTEAVCNAQDETVNLMAVAIISLYFLCFPCSPISNYKCMIEQSTGHVQAKKLFDHRVQAKS